MVGSGTNNTFPVYAVNSNLLSRSVLKQEKHINLQLGKKDSAAAFVIIIHGLRWDFELMGLKPR